MKRFLGLAAAFALIAPAAAHADGSASGVFNLRATVPVSCWVEPQTGPVMTLGEGVVSGTVLEACNNPGGFRVMASYRTLNTTESALLIYAGMQIDLPHSGDALLRTSTMAQIKPVNYSLQTTQLEAPLVLALSISPN